MKIADGVYVLEVESEVMGGLKKVYPVVVKQDLETVLFDTCFPGQYDALVSEFKKEAVDIKDLTKIVLTHQDIDHSGNLAEILENTSNLEIVAHAVEIPYFNGEKTPVKLAKLESEYDTLTEEMKEKCDTYKRVFAKNRVDINTRLEDGEIIEIVGGIETIFTPGHTPGHTCYYFKESKILISGDMLFIKDGELIIAPESINYDNIEIVKSVKKLLKFDIETIVTYHGGLYTGDVKSALEKLC